MTLAPHYSYHTRTVIYDPERAESEELHISGQRARYTWRSARYAG